MKDLQRIQVKAAVLLSALCLLLSGCGGTELLFSELTAQEVQAWETGESLIQTEDLLGLSAMRRVAHSDGKTLYYNDKTTEIAVETEDGTVWYSNPQDRLSLDASALGRYSSPLLVYVIDSTETTKPMNTMDDCVAYGQAKAESIENGIRVTYHFGKVTKRPLYPQALTAERFQEILSSLDETEQNNMKRYYTEVNYRTVTDPQDLKKLKELYAKIEEVEKLYSLKPSVSALEAKRLVSYFEKAEYTYEQREQDHAEVGYAEKDKSYGNFILPVEYTLQAGKLQVRLDVEGIRSTSNMKIESVLLLPYLNTPGGAQNSQAVISDGCGALMDLSAIRSSGTDEYYETVYGQDYALFKSNSTSNKYQVSFPMYGILTGDGAVMAAAGQGDATAALTAAPRTSESSRGTVGLRFKLIDYAQVKLTSTDTDTVNSYAVQAIDDPISVTFTFLDKEHARWTDVAQCYRQSLLESGALPDDGKQTLHAAVVRLLGAIDDKKPVLGVPCEIIRPLTDFEQAAAIAQELTELLDGMPLAFRYSGWQKGGIKSPVQTGIAAESKLGGTRGLVTLWQTLADQGIALYPDADIQYVYRDSLGDGFSRKRDTVQFITREYAYKPQYNMANFLPEINGLCGYLLRSEVAGRNLARFLKAADGTALNAFCLPYMASDLSSNFDKNAFETRNASRGQAAEWLESVKNSGYGVMSEGANAYSLFALDWAVNLPMEANNHPMVSRAVPFVQMVLSGRVAYAATSFNDTNNDLYYTLKCIETGSSPYITTMWAENAAVKETDYDSWYSANFAGLKSRIRPMALAIGAALKPTEGAVMCDHLFLADDVVQVNYDNGAAVVVNYTGEPVQTPLGTVEAYGWLNGEWR